MEQDDFFIKNILGHVARKCNIQNWSYVIQNFENKIENYFGVIVPVVVNAENGGRTVNVIVKYAPEDHKLKNFGVVTDVFTKEIYFYTKLLPSFLECKTNLNSAQLFPRCYYTSLLHNKEALAIEDMRSKGFQRHTKMFLDSDHVEVALKALAHFHALSMIIQKDKANSFDDNLLQPFTEKFPLPFVDTLKATLENKLPLFEHTKYKSFFDDVRINFEKYLKQSTSKANRLIYGHGDFWKENILFKYEDEKPTQACILDFQAVRQMSPAQDFLYFIMNSTESQTRRENYQNFLHIYYTTLQRTLNGNNIVYTIEMFQKDLNVVAPCCFIILLMSFSVWLGVEIENISVNKTFIPSESETSRREELYKRIIAEIIDDITGYGFM